MKKMIISIDDSGRVFRGSKRIGKVIDGEVEWKHYAYRKHADEVELLLNGEQGEYSEEAPELPAEEPEEVVEEIEDPVTPSELFLEGEGRWYGEANPPVVEWRRKNWSKRAFDKKYAHRVEVLKEIYDKHNMTYEQ